MAFGHHAGGGSADDLAARVAALWAKAAARQSRRNLRRLYDAVSEDNALDYIDPMIEKLLQRGLDRTALHQVARWLATTAMDRGAVKAGIAVLGATGVEPDLDVVRTLGAHEEFTLYSAVGLVNGSEEPEMELWALARSVSGWGRIHCVERLRGTGSQQIREWILREGFRNGVMYEYLAYTAATVGRLVDALRRDEVDRELLTSAGEILEALVMGGPAEDLDDYAEDLDDYNDGADAVEAYLDLIRARAETLQDLQAVSAIRTFLDQDSGWDERAPLGWTATRREAFERACDEILGRDWWDDLIHAGLQSDDPVEWPISAWPHGAADLAATLAASDPNERTRELAAEVLRLTAESRGE